MWWILDVFVIFIGGGLSHGGGDDLLVVTIWACSVCTGFPSYVGSDQNQSYCTDILQCPQFPTLISLHWSSIWRCCRSNLQIWRGLGFLYAFLGGCLLWFLVRLGHFGIINRPRFSLFCRKLQHRYLSLNRLGSRLLYCWLPLSSDSIHIKQILYF